jgi:single-strand DNA-binding protein
MLNQVTLVGRLGRDPKEVSGNVASFTLAIDEKYKDKDGELVSKTEWIDVVTFGKVSQIVTQYVKKGDLILVTGKLNVQKWESEGEKKQKMVVIGLGIKFLQQLRPEEENTRQTPKQQPVINKPVMPHEDDDIPF